MTDWKEVLAKIPLEKIITDYQAFVEKMSQATDTNQLIELAKRQKFLQQKYDLAVDLQKWQQQLTEAEVLAAEEKDPEMQQLAETEINVLQANLDEHTEKLIGLLVPEDERDSKNILLEIRAGAGGDESSLFAGDMLRMYAYLADAIGAKFKVVDQHLGTLGGYKEVVAEVRGADAFSWFKFESGVHRVQRVPDTEKQGRVHTSTITVAVMPIVEQDQELKLDPDDIEVIISTSQGAGGQSVNTTYSRVIMRHKPSGIEAQSQDERSQSQNREKALTVLTSRVFDYYEQQRLAQEAADRKQQVGTGNRSEKIRTYNFPQDRLTDHRFQINWNQLPEILSGKIVEVISQIKQAEGMRALDNIQSSS